MEMGIGEQTKSELRRALRENTHSYTTPVKSPKSRNLGGDFSRDFCDLLKFKESLSFKHAKIASPRGATVVVAAPLNIDQTSAPGNEVLPGGTQEVHSLMDYCNPFILLRRHIQRYRPRVRAIFGSTSRAKQQLCDGKAAELAATATLCGAVQHAPLQRDLLEPRGLDVIEFRQMIERIGLVFKRDVIEAVFRICDADRDGLVNYRELELAIKTHGTDAQGIPGMRYTW